MEIPVEPSPLEGDLVDVVLEPFLGHEVPLGLVDEPAVRSVPPYQDLLPKVVVGSPFIVIPYPQKIELVERIVRGRVIDVLVEMFSIQIECQIFKEGRCPEPAQVPITPEKAAWASPAPLGGDRVIMKIHRKVPGM